MATRVWWESSPDCLSSAAKCPCQVHLDCSVHIINSFAFLFCCVLALTVDLVCPTSIQTKHAEEEEKEK